MPWTAPPKAGSVPLEGLKLLSPLANPGKLVAAPVNYQKHLDEAKADVQIHSNNPSHTLTIHKAGLSSNTSHRRQSNSMKSTNIQIYGSACFLLWK